MRNVTVSRAARRALGGFLLLAMLFSSSGALPSELSTAPLCASLALAEPVASPTPQASVTSALPTADEDVTASRTEEPALPGEEEDEASAEATPDPDAEYSEESGASGGAGATGEALPGGDAATQGDTAQAQLDAVFKRYQTLGAVVCVVENGAVTHTFCYGALDAQGTPITQDTLFRVGSISKMVTAMGVMRLVEAGDVTLDGDLSEAFGFSVRNAQYPDAPITLRQVMSHTAGFRDSGYYNLALRGTVTPLPTLFSAGINAYAFLPDARPGTASHYSNFGGGLLGSLIEQVTGQTVDAYMRAAIFDPLGITAAYQTALLPETVPVSDEYAMPGKTRTSAVRTDTPARTVADPDAAYTLTAGKLTLSAPDLAKLLIALCDGGVVGEVRVLSDSSAAAMRVLQNGIGSVEGDSGRGLCLNIVTDTLAEGRTLYGHGGKANGMLCAAYFDPTDRTGVVMLTNGCNNRLLRDGVGKLSIAVVGLCYQALIDGRHVTADPWLVEDGVSAQVTGESPQAPEGS